MTPPVDLLVHRLVAAFPGRAIIAILPQTSTHGAAQGPDTPTEPPAGPSAVAPNTGAEDAASLTPVAEGTGRTQRPRGKRTLAARAQEVLDREGDVSLSREEWATRLGSGTGRLVERLIRYEAAPATTKGTGKNHRVRLVRACDMVTVLETIEGVRAGKMAPPSWYEDVARAA